MTKLTPEQVEKLEATAEKATRGPWVFGKNSCAEYGAKDCPLVIRDQFNYQLAAIIGDIEELPHEANAVHIANCDPDTILTLCREWKKFVGVLDDIAMDDELSLEQIRTLARVALKGADHDS